MTRVGMAAMVGLAKHGSVQGGATQSNQAGPLAWPSLAVGRAPQSETKRLDEIYRYTMVSVAQPNPLQSGAPRGSQVGP